jgi:hypothetical protein
MWSVFRFSSCIKAKLYNRSHSRLNLPVCKNMVLPIHPQLLQFQNRGKCVGRGRHLVFFSDACWCDVECTSHFLLQMAKVQLTTHRFVLIYMNVGIMYFNVHIVCGVSCLNITVQLTALHGTLYILQVCTYGFRKSYCYICKYCVQ